MKELIKLLLNYMPQLGEAIKWYKQHIKRKAIITRDNKVILVLEADSSENVTKVEALLRKLIEVLS